MNQGKLYSTLITLAKGLSIASNAERAPIAGYLSGETVMLDGKWQGNKAHVNGQYKKIAKTLDTLIEQIPEGFEAVHCAERDILDGEVVLHQAFTNRGVPYNLVGECIGNTILINIIISHQKVTRIIYGLPKYKKS